jgi:hypothetical protein
VPIIFVIFINDMPLTVQCFIFIYADDSKITREVCDEIGGTALQRDLDQLSGWGRRWLLTFQVDKCKVMHLGGDRNIQRSYSMNSAKLETTALEKDLGVWISNSMKSAEHVARAVAKANQILGLIRRSFTFLDCRLMRQLYTSLVRPHLEYSNVIWHPQYQKEMMLLEVVQHRATRMVPGLAKLNYEERLMKLGIPSLSYRRFR